MEGVRKYVGERSEDFQIEIGRAILTGEIKANTKPEPD